MPLSERQHEVRNKGIGSSDAAVAAGLSPFKSPVQLWLEKTGRVEPDNLDALEHIEFGNEMEEVCARFFTKRTGYAVTRRNEPYTLQQGDLTMVANVDRFVLNQDCFLECKNVTEYAVSHWNEGVPPYYRVQVEHQMIAGRKVRSFIAAVIGGNKFRYFELFRNQALSENLIRREVNFWQHIVSDVPPPAQTAEEILALYPRDNGEVIIASPQIIDAWEALLDVRAACNALDEQKKELETVLKVFMGESSTVLLGAGGTKLATWNTNKDKKQTNWKKLATFLQRDLPEVQQQANIDSFTTPQPGNRPLLLKKPPQEAAIL